MLPELARGRNTPAPDATPSWVNLALGAAGKLVEQFPLIMAERTKQLQLEIQLRQMGVANPVAPGQPQPIRQLPPHDAVAIATANRPAQAAPPAQPDKNQVVRLIVNKLCATFDRQRFSGGDVAAMICGEFEEQIEAFGLEKALVDTNEMMGILMQMPDVAGMLAERSQHAKWKSYEEDFLGYMQDRYGEPEEPGQALEKKTPQAVA